MQTEIIKLENLYFDPDNLRYDDDFTFNEIPKDRIMNKSNQIQVYKKLQNDISELKDSIIENDFLYIEMIIADKIDEYALEILDVTRNPFEAINNSKILKDKELEKTLKKVLDSLKSITVTDLKELSDDSKDYMNEIEKLINTNNEVIKLFKND